MNMHTPSLVDQKTLRIIVSSSEDAFNRVSANELQSQTRQLIDLGIETPNLTLARGSTQTGIYADIRQSPEILGVLSQARFFQLDEVMPAQKTFKEFSEEEIIGAIFGGNIPTDRWITFNTDLSPTAACDAMRNEFEWYGNIHLALLGVGAEGDDHYAQVREGISVNESVISPELSEGMIQSYVSYLGDDIDPDASLPRHGLSLSHGAMPDNVIVTAKGANKATPIFKMLCEGRRPNEAPEISTTYLRDLQNVTVILDGAAAERVLAFEACLPKRTTVEFER